MKHFYFAVTTSEGGKNFAHVEKASGSDNIIAVFARIPNIITANACESKKEAEAMAEQWNESYKANGTYLFA